MLFIFLLIAETSVYTQKLMFEKLGVNEGLPASEVYNLFEDRKGYVWVFTEFGMVKNNGSRFIPVCKNLPLKESAVYAVTESPGGNIYIANSKVHIYRIHDDAAYPVSGLSRAVRDIISHGRDITEICIDDKLNLRLTSQTMSYSFHKSQYFTKRLPAEKMLFKRKNQVYSIRRTNPLKPVYQSDLTFGRSDCKPFNNSPFFYGIGYVRAFLLQRKGCFYVATDDQFVKIEGSKKKWLDFDNIRDIIHVTFGPNGHIWLGTNGGGLLELDANLNILNHYLGTSAVSRILFDSQAGMWVSTIGDGVYHCNNINKKSYANISGLDEDISMIKPIGNQLFIGTQTGRMFVIENSTFRELTFATPTRAPNDILFQNGQFYVGTKSTTYSFDASLLHSRDLRKKNIECINYSMQFLSKTKFLITTPNFIVLYDTKAQSFSSLNYITLLRGSLKRHTNEILFSARKGIGVWADHKVKFPGYLKPLIGKNVSRMRKDKYNNIWFCTKGYGIFCLDKKNKLTHLKNLPSDIVYDINFTKNNLVLLSTNKGAFYNKVSSMNNLLDWRIIFRDETTQMCEFENQLYIGTKSGLKIVSTDKLTINKSYRFYLTSILAGGQAKKPVANLGLPYDRNNLRFNYDLLDYQSVSDQLVYELIGGDKTLKDTVAGTTIGLQNLEPGEYKLTVTPLILFEDSDKLKNIYRFTIYPAFWQTIWFRIAAVLVFILLVMAVALFVAHRRNKRKKVKDGMEKLLAGYRLTALKSQINPHFMSNSLVAIQNLILENETDNANLYLAKFSLLLRSLLDYSNKSSALLSSELSMIELYVELEQLRFSNKFVFEMEIDQEVNTDEIVIPTLITQPFIENAIWHGLLPLKDHAQAKLILKITIDSKELRISIIDNGVGRSYNERHNKNRNSRGTELIVSRIETLNQLYQVSGGKIEFVDLYDTEGNPAGTNVTIVLPQIMLNEL